MQPEDIDKLFRDRLQHHAPAPPDHLWAQLEAELQPAKKRPAMWLYAAAAVITLLLAAGGGWFWRAAPRETAGPTLATTPQAGSGAEKPKIIVAPQATVPAERPSTTPEAGSEALATTTETAADRSTPGGPARRATTRFRATSRLVARTGPTARPATPKTLATGTPTPAVAVTARAAAPPERPLLATGLTPTHQPTATAGLVAPTAPTGPIVVEVRRTTDTPGANAYAVNEADSRGRLGNLLLKAGKKVGNAVLDGRVVNLPKVELPEVVTAQVETWATSSRP